MYIGIDKVFDVKIMRFSIHVYANCIYSTIHVPAILYDNIFFGGLVNSISFFLRYLSDRIAEFFVISRFHFNENEMIAGCKS